MKGRRNIPMFYVWEGERECVCATEWLLIQSNLLRFDPVERNSEKNVHVRESVCNHSAIKIKWQKHWDEFITGLNGGGSSIAIPIANVLNHSVWNCNLFGLNLSEQRNILFLYRIWYTTLYRSWAWKRAIIWVCCRSRERKIEIYVSIAVAFVELDSRLKFNKTEWCRTDCGKRLNLHIVEC